MTAETLSALAGLLGHRLGDGAVRAYEAGARRAGEELGVSGDEVVRRALAKDRRAYEVLLAWVTVPETYLFRNPEHFSLAARHAQSAAAAGRPLRSAWSVGCSTGEEAYSLAQVLLPHAPGLRVVGSDVSPRALAQAREGRFGAWSFRQQKPQALGWEPVPGGWRAPERLRSAVVFHEANLATRAWLLPPELGGGADVIFCRNLILYFAPEPAAQLLRTLVDTLADGGLLVLGALEVPALLPPGLERLPDADGCAFLKRNRPVARAAPTPSAPRRTRAAAAAQDGLAAAQRLVEAGQLRAALAQIQNGPGPAEWELAATLCIELGETARAMALLQRVIAENPAAVGAHLRLALLASRGGEADLLAQALDALERLTDGKPLDAEVEPGGMRVGYVRAALAELGGGWRETGS